MFGGRGKALACEHPIWAIACEQVFERANARQWEKLGVDDG
jgi:hypothetical protein